MKITKLVIFLWQRKNSNFIHFIFHLLAIANWIFEENLRSEEIFNRNLEISCKNFELGVYQKCRLQRHIVYFWLVSFSPVCNYLHDSDKIFKKIRKLKKKRFLHFFCKGRGIYLRKIHYCRTTTTLFKKQKIYCAFQIYKISITKPSSVFVYTVREISDKDSFSSLWIYIFEE